VWNFAPWLRLCVPTTDGTASGTGELVDHYVRKRNELFHVVDHHHDAPAHDDHHDDAPAHDDGADHHHEHEHDHDEHDQHDQHDSTTSTTSGTKPCAGRDHQRGVRHPTLTSRISTGAGTARSRRNARM